MADAETKTFGLSSSAANVSAISRVPFTRLSRMRRFFSCVQRPSAIGSPARCTAASCPSSPSESTAPSSGSQRTAAVPGALNVCAPPRTSRVTLLPSASSERTSARPTRPVEPVTMTFIQDSPPRLFAFAPLRELSSRPTRSLTQRRKGEKKVYTRKLSDTSGGQGFERDLSVVEGPLLRADDLVVLVSLARDDDEVARARLYDCALDGLAPVNDFKVRPSGCAQARFNVAQDRLRVFRARVVGRGYDDVAQAGRGLAHRRALRTVAVAAAAEDPYDPTARHAACRPKDVSERVVRVRVVNDHGEVARIRHALEAARRARASAQGLGGRVQTERECVRARRGGQYVVDVRAAPERRLGIARALRRGQPKPPALHRELDVARRDLRTLV